MGKEEISEELKLALSKGESLKQAVFNLYKQGYKKEEIEDVVRELHLQMSQQKPIPRQIVNIKIKEEILGGLKLALSKGESLKQAMMSFYNAGYKKQDIEDAARTLHMQEHPSLLQKPIEVFKQKFFTKKPGQIPGLIVNPQTMQKTQNISDYQQQSVKPKGKIILFLLIFILLVLIGALTSLFIFKSEVVSFINAFLAK
ncbi:MAG: hypothetical protein KJ646_01770 [Nanoarchaeota archaeon]|nr:hypothetical protein [Nanoarchaeota archaeon]MBU4116807.1 hypothetical protein [Nanoarchaeota archaeon]